MGFLFFVVANQNVIGPGHFMIITDDMITASCYIIVIPSNGSRFRTFGFIMGTNDRGVRSIGYFIFISVDHVILGYILLGTSQCILYPHQL